MKELYLKIACCTLCPYLDIDYDSEAQALYYCKVIQKVLPDDIANTGMIDPGCRLPDVKEKK